MTPQPRSTYIKYNEYKGKIVTTLKHIDEICIQKFQKQLKFSKIDRSAMCEYHNMLKVPLNFQT